MPTKVSIQELLAKVDAYMQALAIRTQGTEPDEPEDEELE